MKDSECVDFLQWALPQMGMRWSGFRKVRRQVCKRIHRRLGELGLDKIDAYRSYLAHCPEEWEELEAQCRIPISRFYRDRGVCEFLGEEVLPALIQLASEREERHIDCWSAGCASGEEPYTLSLIWTFCDRNRPADMGLQVIATEADEGLLARARRGLYRASRLKDLP